MTMDMYRVADGIMDSAIEEYRTDNLKDVESVQAYAENGLEIYLSCDEAARVLDACRKMQARLDGGEILGSIDWDIFADGLIDY